jgi:predicted RND superfamily exporter protein
MRETLLGRATRFVTEHNVVVLVVMVLLTGGILAGIPQLDTSSQSGGTADQFEDVDRVQKSQYIEDAYGNATDDESTRTFDPVYVWNEGGNALSKESLLAGLRYQQAVTENETVQAALHDDGIQGIENLVGARAADGDGSLDAQIAALESMSDSEVEAVLGRVLDENPRATQFLPTDHEGTTSADRRTLAVLDTTVDSETREDAESVLYEAATERSDAGFFMLSSDAYDEATSQFFGEMVELVLPVALALILFILVFAYRDIVDVVVGMTGVVLSVLWTFGLLGWLGVEAGLMSIIPVVLIAGLSIDFGFHVFNRYREERGPEDEIRAPMARGVALVATALVLVAATASIGFLANLSNPLPVIRDLGVTVTLGVVSALGIFVTVVPALKISIDRTLERVGLDRRKAPLGHGTYLRPVLEQSVTLARRAAPVVLVLAVLVAASGGVVWTQLDQESYQQADGDVAEWKQQLPGPLGWEETPIFEQQRHVESVYQPANADDAIQSDILVEGDVTSPSTLEAIDAGVQTIGQEGLLIDQARTSARDSPLTAMQRVAAESEEFAAVFAEADTDGNGVPDQNLAEVYDALYAADSETAGQVIERVDGEYRSVLVTLSLDADFSESSAIAPKLDDGAAVMADDGQRTATAAGPIAVNEAVLDNVIDGVVTTMLVALAAIVLALVVVFRLMHGSATLGAAVACPIVLVVGLVVAAMYLLDIPLTLLTALLMSLVVGLGIDYNIHIGDRFADELREGADSVSALRTAVTGTGGALLGSTLTSAGAFATIALVPHPQVQSFGSIVVVALVTAFVVSFLVLPSVLLLWSRYAGVSLAVSTPTEEPTPQD